MLLLPECLRDGSAIRAFGVLCFELITGTVLFSRDMNLDQLTSEAEKEALIHWTTLSSKYQLGLVFKSANATKAQRLFAQVFQI